jgi:hypothetical protein
MVTPPLPLRYEIFPSAGIVRLTQINLKDIKDKVVLGLN